MIPIYTNGDLSFNIFPCSPKMLCDPKFYCQAQFKFSCSSVQFELRLSLKPGYYHPPTQLVSQKFPWLAMPFFVQR